MSGTIDCIIANEIHVVDTIFRFIKKHMVLRRTATGFYSQSDFDQPKNFESKKCLKSEIRVDKMKSKVPLDVIQFRLVEYDMMIVGMR